MIVDRKKIGIVILAAGASTRMKTPKQILRFEGKTFLRRAVETAIKTECEKICVVLGANFELIKKEIEDLPAKICFNENWQKGMSSSLQAGLKNLLSGEENLSGVLVMLCDQPFVDADLLNRLIEDFQNGENLIAACEYAGIIGVPAIFSSKLFDEIWDLKQEHGAKILIKKYADSVKKISAPQAEFDIDTPQDFSELENKIIEKF